MILGSYLFKSYNNIGDFFSGAQRNVDSLISTDKTLVEDVRAFNVEYKAELEKKNVFYNTLFKGF